MEAMYFQQKIDEFKRQLSELKSKVMNLNKSNKNEEEALDEEMKFYEKEHPRKPEKKALRESEGQDISAI